MKTPNFTAREMERVAEILKHHVGSMDQISSKRIGAMLSVKDDGTRYSIRNLIHYVSAKYQLPIAGTKNGYYLMETTVDLKLYLDNLDSRIDAMKHTKELAIENFHAFKAAERARIKATQQPELFNNND